jgi:hypothetical protein
MIERDLSPLRAKLDAMDKAARSELTSAPWEWATAETESFSLSKPVNKTETVVSDLPPSRSPRVGIRPEASL